MAIARYTDFPNDLESNALITNLEVIRQSVRRLLLTPRGSLIDKSDYGCDLEQFLYIPMTESTEVFIGMEVRAVIKLYEPRVRIEGLSVKKDEDKLELSLFLKLFVPEYNAYVDLLVIKK